MGGMAAATLCGISFVVFALGNGVVAGVNASEAVGSADADHLHDPSSSLPLNTSAVGTVQSQSATGNEGAKETVLPITDATSLPAPLDTAPLPSSSHEESQPNPSVGKTEDAAADIQGMSELNQATSVPDKSASQEKPIVHSTQAAPETAALAPEVVVSSHVTFVPVKSEKEDPAQTHGEKTPKEAKNIDSTEGEHVPITENNILTKENENVPLPTAASLVRNESILETNVNENSENSASQKDSTPAHIEVPAKEANDNVNTEGENVTNTKTDISIKGNENTPVPPTASLPLNETSSNDSLEAAKGKNVGLKLDPAEDSDPSSQNSSSAGNTSNATELHVIAIENEKLSPPTVESLVEDGKSILPNNNETPDADPELPVNTQASQVQNISSDEVILPVGSNSTNTTGKPSKKPSAEKCPTDSVLPCVSKCCPYGQALVRDKCRPSLVRFVPQFTLLLHGFNDTKPENETEKMAKYNLVAQNICVKNRYRLDPVNDSVDHFHLLFNGSLWLPETKPQHSMIPSDRYCMEVYKIGEEEMMMPLVCFDDPKVVESSFHFMVYPIGLLISVPFLLATFIVYNMIPELRNLHGKSLSCYVLCLMMAYIFLAVVQLGSQGFDNNVCVGVAFAIQFSFIACFFWLNVLCFDTWRNVFLHGDLGYTMEKSQERSFFIFYSIYAWSFTIVLIIVTMVMNFTPTIPSSYLKPGIGEKTCWFNTEREAFPYFYGPVGVLIIINVVLFIMTAIKLILEHHKQAICVRTPTQTFQLCLTLFFIMGINWVMEIISWAAGGPPFIWYITDICNTLQGIFIFVVFVMDERVRGLCKTELFPRLQEFFAACCPQRRTRRASTEPHYDSINGQEMVYMFKKEDIEQ